MIVGGDWDALVERAQAIALKNVAAICAVVEHPEPCDACLRSASRTPFRQMLAGREFLIVQRDFDPEFGESWVWPQELLDAIFEAVEDALDVDVERFGHLEQAIVRGLDSLMDGKQHRREEQNHE